MYSRMLIPLDGSKTAEKVLPFARFVAGALKLPVELLAVVDIVEMATHISADRARYYAVNYNELLTAMRDEAVDYLKKKAEAVKKMGIADVSLCRQGRLCGG
jgi:nucleotide-binding universal stress UspA family protein